MRRTKSFFAVATCAAAVAGLGAGSALAGEITGNGTPKEVHGKSICAFSGQNDEPNDPVDGGRVQSFGQIVRHVGPLGGIPGIECRGNLGS